MLLVYFGEQRGPLTFEPTQQHRHGAGVVTKVVATALDNSQVGMTVGVGYGTSVEDRDGLVVAAVQHEKIARAESFSGVGRPNRTNSFGPRVEREGKVGVADDAHLAGQNQQFARVTGPVLEVGRSPDGRNSSNQRVRRSGFYRQSAARSEAHEVYRVDRDRLAEICDRPVQIPQPPGQGKISLGLAHAATGKCQSSPAQLGGYPVGELGETGRGIDAATDLGGKSVGDYQTWLGAGMKIYRPAEMGRERTSVNIEAAIHERLRRQILASR